MRLVMNPGHKYPVYTKMVQAGEEFDVPDNEAEIWMKLGRARRASTKVEVAESGDENSPAPESASSQRVEGSHSKRKRYTRSDLRAEEE